MRLWVVLAGTGLIAGSLFCARLVDYERICGEDADCPPGFSCVGGTCRVVCASDRDCPFELPECHGGLCTEISVPECSTAEDCGDRGDGCIAGRCACAGEPGCPQTQLCEPSGCACPPTFELCGDVCLPPAACCTNLECDERLCTLGACDCAGGQTDCVAGCVFFALCCDEEDGCPAGQACTRGACCATPAAESEVDCADRVDNDCDALVDCLDQVDCPAGTPCAANGAKCRDAVCGLCPAGEDLDGDGVCASEDCDDSAATGAGCASGCLSYCRDADGDGYGSPADQVTACATPSGYVGSCDDCADLLASDPACGGGPGSGCHPAALELCDGIENDCDPTTVDGTDESGFGDACDGADTDLCPDDALVVCAGPALGCDPAGDDDLEACDDGLDNDCDGATDCADSDCDGAACDDGLFCTLTDVCGGGTCSGGGDPCAARVGDADDDCSESCDEDANDCVAEDPPASPCDDGIYCNGADSCATGACTGHAGDPCSMADADCSASCRELERDCAAPSEPDGSPCDDTLYCTGADTCLAGACTEHAGDPCGLSDANCAGGCSEAGRNCSLAFEPAGSPCDDTLYCNGTDVCNATGGCSVHTGDPCGPASDADCAACNETAENCSNSEPSGSACDDGLFCNGADQCSGGACTVHPSLPCAMADADCTGGCDESTDTCTAGPEPVGSPCNDGVYCNGTDHCGASGCGTHAGDPCTDPQRDTCYEDDDRCCTSGWRSETPCSIGTTITVPSQYQYRAGWCITEGCLLPPLYGSYTYYFLTNDFSSARCQADHAQTNPATATAPCNEPTAWWDVTCGGFFVIVKGTAGCTQGTCSPTQYDATCNPI